MGVSANHQTVTGCSWNYGKIIACQNSRVGKVRLENMGDQFLGHQAPRPVSHHNMGIVSDRYRAHRTLDGWMFLFWNH